MMEYSKGHWTTARRRSKVGLTDPVTIMDEALSVLLGVIDLNIDEQELLIDLRKTQYDSEREVLRQLHRYIAKNCSLQSIVNQRSASYLLTVEHETSKQLLFRFYRRLEERLFKKFLYYSINGKNVQFTKRSIVQLYNLNKESMESKKAMRSSLQLFHEIIKLVLKQNEELMEKLLEFIVDNNFVSSVDQFNLLRSHFAKEQKDSEMMVDSDDEYHERRLKPRMTEESDENSSTVPDLPAFRKHCSMKNTFRSGRKDVRRHLESLMCKYADAEARESFVTQLSQNIIKEVIEQAANQQQEQNKQHLKKVQDYNFLKNIHHIRRASDGMQLYSTSNDLNTQSSLHQNDLDKKRITKQQSFFVSTKSQFLETNHQVPFRISKKDETPSNRPSRNQQYKQVHIKTNKLSLVTVPQQKRYDHVESRFKNSMGKLNQMRAQSKLIKTKTIKISMSNPNIPTSFYKKRLESNLDYNSILNILRSRPEHPQGHINKLITVGSLDKRRMPEHNKEEVASEHRKLRNSQQNLELQWSKIIAYDGMKVKETIRNESANQPLHSRKYDSCDNKGNMSTQHDDGRIFKENKSQKTSQTMHTSDIASILRQIIYAKDTSHNIHNDQVKPRRSVLTSKSTRKRLYSIWPFRQLFNVRDKKILQP